MPTLAELKLPRAAFEAWHGVAAPAGTPKPVLQRLTMEIAAVMALPEVQARLQAGALEPVLVDAPAATAQVESEIATYAAVGKRANLSMD